MSRALVLNVTYEPLSVVAGRRAAVLVLADKADLVHESGIELHSERLVIEVPSVIRLRQLVRVPYDRHVPLSRRAVFVRDQHECQYCSGPAETLDHVIPAAAAGCTAGTTSSPPAAGATCARATGCSSTPTWCCGGGRRWPAATPGSSPRWARSRRPGSSTSRPRERRVAVELRRVRLDLRNPLAAGHATIARREVVLVRVTLPDGTEGWGECAALERPTYSSETTDGAWALLRDELVPAALAGRGTRRSSGHPMATAALADARLDAELRASGTSLAAALGATPDLGAGDAGARHRAPSVDELLARVDAAPAGVKLKIAPGWDLEPLRAVRAAFPDRWLAADANGGYRVDDLPRPRGGRRLRPRLPRAAAARPDAAPPMRRACWRTPVVLDEPIGDVDTVRAAIALGGLGGLNLKPGKGGGLQATARAIAVAAGEGIDVFVGGMLETGVGRAGAVALAALDACTWPTDLGPSDWYFAGGPDRADRRRRRRPARRARRARHRGGARRRPPRRGHGRARGARRG